MSLSNFAQQVKIRILLGVSAWRISQEDFLSNKIITDLANCEWVGGEVGNELGLNACLRNERGTFLIGSTTFQASY
jgi:hypothetical protein